jgi:hypothetical protein
MTRYAKSHTHTHTQIRVIIHTSEQGYMRPYLHDEICQITHTHRSCCTWSLNKLHFCWWPRELIPGLQWDHIAKITGHKMISIGFWNPNFGLQEPRCDGKAAAGFPSACTSWCQEVLGYLPRTQLRARGMSQESSGSCVRGMSNPVTHITRILLATDGLRRRKKREKQKLAPYKIYSLRHS